MAIIPIPPGIRDIEWTLPPRAAWTSKSGYSGKQTVIDRGTVTGGYRASVTVVPATIAQARQWRAWAALMKGPVNTVELSPTAKSQDGVLATSVAFNANTAAGTSAFVVYTVSGLAATVLMKAGSFVQIASRLHLLTADLSFGVETPNPLAGMNIDPPLPAAAVAGQAVLVRYPKCTMKLADGQTLGFKVSPGGIYEPTSFDLEEVL